MIGTITLPARLDFTHACTLADDILARSGADLAIDAGQVDHLGALAAQVLLAAAADWARSGHCLTIAPRSPAFDDAVVVLGLDAHLAPGTRQ